MDSLARLAPVAMPLLRDVDAALATLGSPPAHPIWRLLGSVGMTPADLVAFAADLEPGRLRAAGAALRQEERTYSQLLVPVAPSWSGAAARNYATTAAALRDHLERLMERLRATASYVEDLAERQQGLRDALAQALAAVIASHEAVALRTHRAHADPAALTAAAAAAAEIGAVLLRVGEEAAATYHHLLVGSASLEELAYDAPGHTSQANEGRIDLR
jgi:hypothetical protein